jgi:hypothetical protein
MADLTTNTDAPFEAYRYNPSLATAVVFILLFVFTTAMHSYQLLRTRTWYFIPFIVGGFCELVFLPLP